MVGTTAFARAVHRQMRGVSRLVALHMGEQQAQRDPAGEGALPVSAASCAGRGQVFGGDESGRAADG